MLMRFAAETISTNECDVSGKAPDPMDVSFPGYCPFEEGAGSQTSTASTGRRGLAWADSVG